MSTYKDDPGEADDTPGHDDGENAVPDEVAVDYLKAVDIIKQFILDLTREGPVATDDTSVDHNARALVARLAHQNMVINSVEVP